MKHILDRTGSPDGLAEAMAACCDSFAPAGLMILATESNKFSPETIDPVLKEAELPLFGGVFPAILHGREVLEEGTLVLALPQAPRLQLVRGLYEETNQFVEILDESLIGSDGRTMFVFVDGLAPQIGNLLNALFYVYGLDVNYLGGGAGPLLNKAKPCLMTGDGMVGGAALLAAFDLHSGVGVSHGLESVSGPHAVNDIRGNWFGLIDWEPAGAKLEEMMRQFDPELRHRTRFPVSNEFCLGLSRLDGEKVIRDPLEIDDSGAIHVVTEMSEGECVDLMRATPEAAIHAASVAAERARDAFSGRTPYESILCFDCFARRDYLGERFDEEMAVLQDERCQLLGALSMGGEIANTGKDYLDYYNRSCVVGTLGGSACCPNPS